MIRDQITTLPVFHRSLVDKCWYQLTTVLNFGVPKRIQVADSSLSPSLSPCRSSGNHPWRLFQKTIKFDCKINGQALGQRLGTTGKNTGSFWVGCSCGQRQALFDYTGQLCSVWEFAVAVAAAAARVGGSGPSQPRQGVEQSISLQWWPSSTAALPCGPPNAAARCHQSCWVWVLQMYDSNSAILRLPAILQ